MKTKKWFKRVLAATVSAGSSLVIAACYGAFYGMQEVASGRVTHNSQGVSGLQVCAEFQGGGSDCTITNGNGYYTIEAADHLVDAARQNGYTIVVTDIDGEDNGGLFQEAEVPVDPLNVPGDVDVQVDLEPASN